MTKIVDRRTSRAALWARRLAVFSAVLLLTSAAGHRSGLVDTPAFLVLLAIVASLAVMAALSALVGLFRLWEYGDRGGAPAVAGLLIAALILSPYGFLAWRAVTLPSLADISTDAVEPPSLSRAAALRDATMNPVPPFSAAAGRVQAAAYPEIIGRRYALPLPALRELAIELFAARGWAISSPDLPSLSAELTLEGVARTPLLGFPSDVAVRLTDEGETTYVDMRAASRFGPHDLGANAWLIETYLRQLDALVMARGATAPAGE